MTWICPKCGIEFTREHPLHAQACQNHPGIAQLRQFIADGYSGQDIADECDVSTNTIHNWLRNADLQLIRGPRATPRKPLDLVKHLRIAKCKPCEHCPFLAECRERVRAGLWVHCEMPERDHVERCIRQGLVPADILTAVPAAAIPADDGR